VTCEDIEDFCIDTTLCLQSMHIIGTDIATRTYSILNWRWWK